MHPLTAIGSFDDPQRAAFNLIQRGISDATKQVEAAWEACRQADLMVGTARRAQALIMAEEIALTLAWPPDVTALGRLADQRREAEQTLTHALCTQATHTATLIRAQTELERRLRRAAEWRP